MKLTVVGLPIGNLSDISERALDTMARADMVVCEDTRMFSNLWSKLVSLGKVQAIKTKIKFVNDFNESRVLPKLVEEIRHLENVVLVSDAGMPTISDPGYKLIRSGLDLGWEVTVIPGPTAESAAISISGLPTDKYLFLGFLPKKQGKRVELLKNIKQMSNLVNFSVVIYESIVRLEKIIGDLVVTLGGNTSMCLAVDLTKVSEKVYRGTISEIVEILKEKKLKGEATIVLSLSN